MAANSINVGSTENYPTDTSVIITIRTVDTSGNLISGTQTEWKGIVAGDTSITIDPTPVYGDDQVYAAGSTTQVVIYLSSYAWNDLIDGILVEHNQDGTHNSTLASTLKAAMGSLMYPVGSIYTNASDSTNPATLLGFGTWTAFGAGKVPVGFNSADSDFNTAEKTGGEKTHKLTTTEMPSHGHGVTDPGHNHSQLGRTNGPDNTGGSWYSSSQSTVIGNTAGNTTN